GSEWGAGTRVRPGGPAPRKGGRDRQDDRIERAPGRAGGVGFFARGRTARARRGPGGTARVEHAGDVQHGRDRGRDGDDGEACAGLPRRVIEGANLVLTIS